ncbi:MAG: HPP family protein [Aureliella sp.]
MNTPLESLKPIAGAEREPRRRLSLKHELVLAFLPTLMVLLVLSLVESLAQQRLLFSSLASSAFLIYLDPQHGTNTVRTLTISHFTAALIGLATSLLLPDSYAAAGVAMVLTIGFMVVFDAVHPPAVSTSLIFAFRAEDIHSLALFMLSLIVIALLVALERAVLWLMPRLVRREERRKQRS